MDSPNNDNNKQQTTEPPSSIVSPSPISEPDAPRSTNKRKKRSAYGRYNRGCKRKKHTGEIKTDHWNSQVIGGQ